jgi:murein DD-endopeptidase MepM/ murein hydrolase activator NlpD
MTLAGPGLVVLVFLGASSCGLQEEVEEGVERVASEVAEGLFQVSDQPVPIDALTNVGWYGNTEYAYEHQGAGDFYGETQGLHPGVDWFVPVGTPVRSPIPLPGKVISISADPYDWKACPNAVAVRHGDYIVLYGHLSRVDVDLDDDVLLGDQIGASGTAQGCADGVRYGSPHLHLEVIHYDHSAGSGERPGSVRTNPVRFFTSDVFAQAGELASGTVGTFRPTPACPSIDAREQPDIVPGSPLACP